MSGYVLIDVSAFPVMQGQGFPVPNMSGRISGEVHWKGAVAPLWSFVPLADCRVNGEGMLDVKLDGSLHALRPSGTLMLSNVNVEDLLSGVALSGIGLQASLNHGGHGYSVLFHYGLH